MPKPTIGQTSWGDVLNAHLDTLATDIASKASVASLASKQDASTLDADVAAELANGASASGALLADKASVASVALKQAAADLDDDVAAKVPDTGTAVGAALAAAFASRTSRSEHAPALGIYFPEAEGAVGDGVVDDSAAVQAAFTLAGNTAGRASVYLNVTYRVLTNLYVFGTVDVDGPGELLLDGDLALSDGVAYWINVGVKSKGGVASTWTGRMSINLRATANARVERMLNVHRAADAHITRCKIDLLAHVPGSLTYPGGGLAGYNNGAWCASPSRERIWVTDNTLLANQSSAFGSEGIGFGAMSHLWIKDNYIHGFGDDPIGLHNVTDFEVSGNRCWSRDGRLYFASAQRGKIHNNRNERIANPDASWTSGGGLMEFSTEVNTQPGPIDVEVYNNTLIHGSGITSATYGIRLRGVRRFRVYGNKIHDTTGFGYGITWEGQALAGWTDALGLEVDDNIRVRDLDVYENTVTGTGADGRIGEVLVFAGHAAGPITLRGNKPGVGGTSLYTPAAYSASDAGSGGSLPKLKTGVYYAAPNYGVATGAPPLSTMSAQPVVIDQTTTLAALAVRVTTTGGAGAVARLGIYADNGSGYPGALVADFGTMTTVGAAPFDAEKTMTQVLKPGVYWIAYAAQVATATVRCHFPIQPVSIGAPTLADIIDNGTKFGYNQTGVPGALPATFTTTVTPNGGLCPRIAYKFA